MVISGVSRNLEMGGGGGGLSIDYIYAYREGKTESVGLFSLLIFFLGQLRG